jgi:hypothetical protein
LRPLGRLTAGVAEPDQRVAAEIRDEEGNLARTQCLHQALAEHVALYPLSYFVDRYHPARGQAGIPPLVTNPRAFVQATLRHVLFGAALGRLSR